MLWHDIQRRAKPTIHRLCLAFACASVILIACATQSDAETPALLPTEPMTQDALKQQGAQLRADIDATYKQLRASKSLKNTVNDGNDVTAIVLKYIPLGMPFDKAEAILRAAGCTIGPQQGHIVARTHMRDGFFQSKHGFAAELVPQTPGNFNVVHDISARIYLEYVPNANNR
jgi:hypothetical protein